MISYPFSSELFTNVLSKSKRIGGRFHLCPKYGLEINSDQLGEVIKDLVIPANSPKYDMALMMPPRSYGNYTDKNVEWEQYKAVMFFLTTTFYNGANQIKSINPNTNTSTHTIPQDWHDMKRCAVNFLRVLDIVQKEKQLVNTKFRLGRSVPKVIQPVSEIGVDRASGVRMEFTFDLFIGCELEDYTTDDINAIIIPVDDSHPEH